MITIMTTIIPMGIITIMGTAMARDIIMSTPGVSAVCWLRWH